MDLSTLSDEELERIASGSAPAAPDLSQMSDSELERIAAGQSPNMNSGYDPQLPVINEQHSGVSLADRLLAKNFANDTAGMAAYLKKENPGLDVQSDGKRVLIRKPDEQAYRVLDPDQGFLGNFTNPTEALKDVGDSIWSLGSGVVTGLGTAAGAVAGAPTGPGAIPAAMAAGGATASGMELARQGVGGLLGVGGFSPTDLALEGAMGAASPLLFGTGAGVKDLAKAGASELTQKVSQGALPAAFKFGASKVLPQAHQLATGIPADVTRHAYENLDRIKQMEQDPNFVRSFAQETQEMVQQGLATARRKVGKEFEMGLKESPAQIGLKLNGGENSVLAPIDDLFRERAAESGRAFGNKTIDDELLAVQKIIDDVLVGIPVNERNEISAYGAWQLKKRLEAQAKPFLTGKAGQDVADNELGAAIKQVADRLDEGIKVSVVGNKQLAEKYSFLRAIEKESKRDFSTPEATFRTLRTLGAPSKGNKRGLFGEIDRELGKTGTPESIAERAKDMQALMMYGGKVATDALGSAGVTSTTRTNTLGFLGGGLASLINKAMGTGLPTEFVAPVGYFMGAKAASPAAARYGVMEPAKKISSWLEMLPEGTPQMLSDAAAFEYVRTHQNKDRK